MHPELLFALARQQQRFDERRQQLNREVPRRSPLRASVAGRARHAMGWLLVETGLRLALADRDGLDALKAQ